MYYVPGEGVCVCQNGNANFWIREGRGTHDRLYQMSHCVSIPMIFVSAIFARLSRQMTCATLTAKMALTAKMCDCSSFMAWIIMDYTYCQNGGQRVLIKNHGHNFG